MIYLICFGASALCAHFAYKASFVSDIKRKRMLIILFSSLCILIPTLLAGLREYNIGIDTHNYLRMKRYWSGAIDAESLSAYMKNYISIGYGEPLFALLLGFIAQTFANYSVFLFVVHGIIMTGVYIGAYRFRRYVNPTLVLGLFFLIFYNHSLNIIRQYIAMSIIFAFLADILQKKYWRYALAVVFAYWFHKSAVFGILILLVYWFLNVDVEKVVAFIKRCSFKVRSFLLRHSEKTPKAPANTRLPRFCYATVEQRRIILFSALLFVVLVFNPLCRLLIDTGLLHEKYNYYLNISLAKHATLNTLFLLVEIVPLFFFRKEFARKNVLFDFFFTLSGSYLILYQLTAFLNYGKRIALSFGLPNLITLAMIPLLFAELEIFKKWKWFRDHPLFQKVIIAMIFAAALIYWLYVYVWRNASQTVPYNWVF